MVQKIVRKLARSTEREEKRLLLLWILSVTVATIGGIFLAIKDRKGVMREAEALQQLFMKAKKLGRRFSRVKELEEGVLILAKARENFSFQDFFERAYKQAGLQPSGTWSERVELSTKSLDGRKRFIETTIKVVFQHATANSLVEFLRAVYNEPRVYLKSLSITPEGRGGMREWLKLEVTVATKTVSRE